MRDLFTMWRSTRMVVLTAITAALYAAALVAFKFLSLFPGVKFRPGVALVMLGSILFGPAGAWGAAIGNAIGDFAGSLEPGAIFGIVGNLLFGLVPYKLYRALGVSDPTPRDAWTSAAFVVVALTASGACGLVVGWGMEAVMAFPFKIFANSILITNGAICIALGTFLARAIYPRVAALGLRYQDILDLPPARRSVWGLTLAAVMVGAVASGLIDGNAREFGYLGPHAPPMTMVVGVPLLVLLLAMALVD